MILVGRKLNPDTLDFSASHVGVMWIAVLAPKKKLNNNSYFGRGSTPYHMQYRVAHKKKKLKIRLKLCFLFRRSKEALFLTFITLEFSMGLKIQLNFLCQKSGIFQNLRLNFF